MCVAGSERRSWHGESERSVKIFSFVFCIFCLLSCACVFVCLCVMRAGQVHRGFEVSDGTSLQRLDLQRREKKILLVVLRRRLLLSVPSETLRCQPGPALRSSTTAAVHGTCARRKAALRQGWSYCSCHF